MKRYILLSGSDYYPAGWDDFRGDFDSVEEAKQGTVEDWAQIVDTETKKIVCALNNMFDRQWFDIPKV